jgi:hypothetical protein
VGRGPGLPASSPWRAREEAGKKCSGARPRPSVPPERVPRASIRATLRRGGTWSSIRKREEPSNHPRMDANGRILPSKRSGAPTKGAGDASFRQVRTPRRFRRARTPPKQAQTHRTRAGRWRTPARVHGVAARWRTQMLAGSPIDGMRPVWMEHPHRAGEALHPRRAGGSCPTSHLAQGTRQSPGSDYRIAQDSGPPLPTPRRSAPLGRSVARHRPVGTHFGGAPPD